METYVPRTSSSVVPHLRRLSTIVPLAIIAALITPSPAAAQHPAISPADLRHRVSIIADDSTLGREAGSRGDDIAARHIAAEFRRLRLEPGGEGGTYFQTVPLVIHHFDPKATVLRAGGSAFAPNTDYVPLPRLPAQAWGRVRPFNGTEVVYGGTWGDATRQIDAAAAAGRFVILTAPAGKVSEANAELRAAVPPHLRAAAAVALATLDATPPFQVDFYVRVAQGVRTLMRLDDGARDSSDVPALLLVSRNTAQRLLGTAPDGAAPGTRGLRVDGRIATWDGPPDVPARNVIAVLRGSDPSLRATYVSISAHHDHVGFTRAPIDHDSLHAYRRVFERRRQAAPMLRLAPDQASDIRVDMDSLRRLGPARPDSVFNGADDDASGIAGQLEIAEDLATARSRPKRSILFLAHTGEEAFLLGSTWYSDHPTVPIDSIVAEIDMDMVGRGAASDLDGGGPDYLELIGSRRQSTEFGDLIDALNAKRPRPFRINYAFDAHDHPEGDWCRADHYSYARYGIPVAAFSTSYHGDYHQVTDDPQYLDYPHLAAIAEFVRDIAVAVANRPARPVLDRPKPADPKMACVQ